MPHETEILFNEAGIQYQGVNDASGGTGAYPIQGLIVGQFKRGRLDKPMTIHRDNIKAMLGYDPQNPCYTAVQDVLGTGVPNVQVLRLGEGGPDWNPGGGGNGGGGNGGGGDGGGDGGGGVGPEIPQEPEWDIKYKVNGQWIYEITGQTVEQSESRNEQYRLSATELVVSDNVTKIGFFAFRFWNALISVKLGNSVTSLGYYSFENCTRLKSIDLPDSLEILEANALGDCNALEVLDFGANLKLIKAWALVNLYQLHTIVFRSNTPFTAEGYAYGNGSSGGTDPEYIYVPDHLINEYEVPLWNLASKESYRPLSQYNG
jgi:BspA type Leucine rich repeat region (6 copies)